MNVNPIVMMAGRATNWNMVTVLAQTAQHGKSFQVGYTSQCKSYGTIGRMGELHTAVLMKASCPLVGFITLTQYKMNSSSQKKF